MLDMIQKLVKPRTVDLDVVVLDPFAGRSTSAIALQPSLLPVGSMLQVSFSQLRESRMYMAAHLLTLERQHVTDHT